MNILCQMFKREVNDGRQMIIVAHNVDSEYLPNNKQYLIEPILCIKWLFLESRKWVLTYVIQGLVSMDAQMFYPARTTSNYYWENIFQHANTTLVQLNLITTLISVTWVFFHFNTSKVMFFANSLEIFLELRTYFFNPLIGLPFTLLPPISTFLN